MNFLVSFFTSSDRYGKICLALFDEKMNVIRSISKEQFGEKIHEEGCQGIVLKNDVIYTCDYDKISSFDFKTFSHIKTSKRIEYKIGNENYKVYGGHSLDIFNDKLYAVYSDADLIAEYDLNLKLLNTYSHIPYPSYNLMDLGKTHINTAKFDKQGNIYVTVHNREREGYVYKSTLKNWGKNQIIMAKNLKHPHDFNMMDDGSYYVNNSANCLFEYTTFPIEYSYKVECNAFTRGVSFYDGSFYVGCSKRVSKNKNKPTKLSIMQIKNGQIVKKFKIPKYNFCSQIYDLKVL